jgi:4-amino-4-deoxy-L-arabinose transferase-like glycosyltransferase
MTTIRAETQVADADIIVPDDRSHARFLWITMLASASLIWLIPFNSSLWLDELVTWWVIKDSLGDTVHRAFAFQGQTVVFYVLEWLVRQVGSEEWLLRVPSFIEVIAGAFILFRLAERLLDREYARLSVFLFVLWPAVSFESSDARPYALALLLLLGAVLMLIRWLDEPSLRRAVAFVVLAALFGYAHLLFVLALPPILVYAVYRYREPSTDVSARALIGSFAAIAALDLGLMVEVVALFERRGVLSLFDIVSFDTIARYSIPTAIFVAILVGSIIALFTVGWRFVMPSFEHSTAVLLGWWLLFPTAVLIVIDLTTSIHLFEARYTLMAAPAAVLLSAAIIRSIEPLRARSIIVACVAVFSVIASVHLTKVGEDWRWGASEVNARGTDHSVVFLQAGLIESEQLDWFSDPERVSYLEAPASYYHFDAPILPVPFISTPASNAFVNQELDALPPDIDRVYFVSRYPGDPFGHYLDGVMAARGWTTKQVQTRGGTSVAEYDRPPTP